MNSTIHRVVLLFFALAIFQMGDTNLLADNALPKTPRFYVPENPDYTIVDSVQDSLRFTLNKTLKANDNGHLVSISTFVTPEAEPMLWHDFGKLEGPGWACNAIGGAYEIYCFGEFLGKPAWQKKALLILDHVLDDGFIDKETGLIYGYRDIKADKFYLNYQRNNDWNCPGSMAKMAYQLLIFADKLGDDPRATRMRTAALKCAQWINTNVKSTPNGWYPRRTSETGELVMIHTNAREKKEPFWQTSADGIFILQLHAALTERRLIDSRELLAQKLEVYMKAGGFYASLNHDTYDPNENVAHAVGFRTLLLASRVLNDDDVRRFAYESCLAGLDHFKMHEDRNGVATKGLLFMEDSWKTAYLWENAEAALAYFEAAKDVEESERQKSRDFQIQGLTILRAIAKHHYGLHGFLTEGVDWDNHVTAKHHIDGAEFGAIRYTEPFLNNQHVTEPTLYYLQHFARRSKTDDAIQWRDIEDNVIFSQDAINN